MIHIVVLERITPQPWRNGGGLTRELLAWPRADEWLARVSVAEIMRDGPFSAYPGIERWFAVVAGDGVVLRWPDRRAVLTPSSEPLRFDGAAPPRAELPGGATHDLNLMLRRDAASGTLRRATPDDEWLDPCPLRAVFVGGAARLQIDDTDAARLSAFSLAWGDHAARQRWRVLAEGAEPLAAWWLSVQPRGVT